MTPVDTASLIRDSKTIIGELPVSWATINALEILSGVVMRSNKYCFLGVLHKNNLIRSLAFFTDLMP